MQKPGNTKTNLAEKTDRQFDQATTSLHTHEKQRLVSIVAVSKESSNRKTIKV